MPIPKPKGSEGEQEFVSRCISEIIDEYGQEQAAAICYNTYRSETKMSTQGKIASYLRQESYKGINLFAGLEDACWPGYEAIGTKILDGREVPNCVPIKEEAKKVEMAEEINVLGYRTKAFEMCPGAVATFKHLVEMPLDEETVGMVRSAAQIADNVFAMERRVIEEGVATSEDLEEAKLLVEDFKDVIEEINEETGMVHDVSYMDGHIVKIAELVK